MISVVTAYYNRKELFTRTLKSMKPNFGLIDFEVIAVDDGSDDSERIEDLVNDFPFLRVIRLEKKDKWYDNPCIPFNIGFNYVKGEKVILQNPECYHYNDILKYVENNLNPREYLCFGCFSVDKTTTDDLELFYDRNLLDEKMKTHLYSPKVDGEFGWYNHSIYRPKGLHFCTAINYIELKKLDGFDERFALGIGYDDDEFLDRVKLRSKIVFVDNQVVLHQNHYNPQSKSYQNRPNKEKLFRYNAMVHESRYPSINFNYIIRSFSGTRKISIIKSINFCYSIKHRAKMKIKRMLIKVGINF